MIIDITVLPKVMPWISVYTTSSGAEQACQAVRSPFTGFALARSVLGLDAEDLNAALTGECVPVTVEAGLQERGTILVNQAGRCGVTVGFNRVAAPAGRAYAITKTSKEWWVAAYRPRGLTVTMGWAPGRFPRTEIPDTQGGSAWGGFAWGGVASSGSRAAGTVGWAGSASSGTQAAGSAAGTVAWAGTGSSSSALRGNAAGAASWAGMAAGADIAGDYSNTYSDTYGNSTDTLALGVLQAGFLGGGYQSNRAAQDWSGGCRVAMYEAFWDRIEQTQGVFDSTQLNTVISNINDLVAKGFKVSLGLGVHYPRAWVDTAAGGTGARFTNQAGVVDAELDYVFNQQARDIAASYISRLLRAIGPEKIWNIRLTSGGYSELLYPNGSGYWAYSAPAQTGVGLAEGQKVCPSPGWVAGTTHPQGSAGVRAWAEWYLQSLANTALWMKDVCDDTGYDGYYEFMMPGGGRHTNGYESDIAANLPVGSVLRRGAAWREVMACLPPSDRFVMCQSGTGDTSGLPSNYIPLESDKTVDLSGAVPDSWGSARWLKAAAEEAGYLVSGENPGYGATPNDRYIGVGDYTGDLSMLSQVFAIITATSTPFHAFWFAHGAQLYEGTLTPSEYYGRVQASSSGAVPADAPARPWTLYDAEGEGDVGGAVTPISSGAQSITTTGAATVTYVAAPDGGLAYRFSIPTTGVNDIAQMAVPLPAGTMDAAADFLFTPSAVPQGGEDRLFTFRHASGTAIFVLILATGQIRVQHAAAGTVATSSTVITGGDRWKLGVRCHVGSTTANGSFDVAIYEPGDRVTPVEVLSSSATNMGTAPLVVATVGKTNPTPLTQPFTVDVDRLRVQPGAVQLIGAG